MKLFITVGRKCANPSANSPQKTSYISAQEICALNSLFKVDRLHSSIY